MLLLIFDIFSFFSLETYLPHILQSNKKPLTVMQSVQKVNWFRMESFGIWPSKSNEFLEKLAPKCDKGVSTGKGMAYIKTWK